MGIFYLGAGCVSLLYWWGSLEFSRFVYIALESSRFQWRFLKLLMLAKNIKTNLASKVWANQSCFRLKTWFPPISSEIRFMDLNEVKKKPSVFLKILRGTIHQLTKNNESDNVVYTLETLMELEFKSWLCICEHEYLRWSSTVRGSCFSEKNVQFRRKKCDVCPKRISQGFAPNVKKLGKHYDILSPKPNRWQTSGKKFRKRIIWNKKCNFIPEML